MNLKIFKILKRKIIKKNSKIGVIGLGYVGLPLALAFSSKKFQVIGIDNNKKKIKLLKKNSSYISTIDKNILKKINNKFFFPTHSYNKLSECDVIIICVPTPLKDNKNPEMKYVEDVINQIKKYSLNNKLLVLECTTYPGTTEKYFVEHASKNKLNIGENFFLGYSPEREDPGNKKYGVLKGNITKVVSGNTKNCLFLTNLLYKKIFFKTYKVSDLKTAEFTKLLENTYRSINISLVNELKKITDNLDIDIYEAINAAKTKPFGFSPFYPGPGVGGHCIPVDPFFLSWIAKKKAIDLNFIKLAGKINDERPKIILKKIINFLKKRKINKYKIKLMIFGVTYKKDSDDIRESPAIKILSSLRKEGFNFFIYDPKMNMDAKKILQRYKIVKNMPPKKRKLKDIKKVALIITNHSLYDYKKIYEQFDLIFDCRNSFSFKSDKIVQL